MKYCYACYAQFPEEHRRCLHCGGRLKARPPQETRFPPNTPPEEAELVLLSRRQPAKAVPLLEQLQAAGIEFAVVGDGGTERVNWLHGSYGAHAAVEIYVHPRHLEQAEAIVHAELSPLAAELSFGSLEPGACPGCHAQLPNNAPECPECGLCFPE